MSPLTAATLVLCPTALVLATILWRSLRNRSPRRAAAVRRLARRTRRQRQDDLEFFHPADLVSLRAPSAQCEGLFPLARDAQGNLYVVDPRQPDPAVVKIDPSASERRVVSPSLSEFLRR